MGFDGWLTYHGIKTINYKFCKSSISFGLITDSLALIRSCFEIVRTWKSFSEKKTEDSNAFSKLSPFTSTIYRHRGFSKSENIPILMEKKFSNVISNNRIPNSKKAFSIFRKFSKLFFTQISISPVVLGYPCRMTEKPPTKI